MMVCYSISRSKANLVFQPDQTINTKSIPLYKKTPPLTSINTIFSDLRIHSHIVGCKMYVFFGSFSFIVLWISLITGIHAFLFECPFLLCSECMHTCVRCTWTNVDGSSKLCQVWYWMPIVLDLKRQRGRRIEISSGPVVWGVCATRPVLSG